MKQRPFGAVFWCVLALSVGSKSAVDRQSVSNQSTEDRQSISKSIKMLVCRSAVVGQQSVHRQLVDSRHLAGDELMVDLRSVSSYSAISYNRSAAHRIDKQPVGVQNQIVSRRPEVNQKSADWSVGSRSAIGRFGNQISNY